MVRFACSSLGCVMRSCLILTALVGLACAGIPLPGETPEDRARAYLEAGTQRDADPTPFIDEGCADSPIGHFAPVRLMGEPIQLTKLEVRLTQEEGDTALVTYSYKGSMQSPSMKTELAGVTIELGSVDVRGFDNSGRLKLVRRDGGWRVACD